MPTVITHAIVGGSLTLFKHPDVSTPRLLCVLAVLPVLPDLDVIAFSFGIPYSHPLGHRGFTHSLPFALIMALLTQRLLFAQLARFTKAWWSLVALTFAATASHGVLDAFTDAGLGVGFFIPFDDSRYFAPWRPIATSPLSISAFFNGPALRILSNELFWIGLPLLGMISCAGALKFVLRKRRWPS